MVTSPDVLAAHLESESVLLDVRSKRYYRLNATAAAVWKGLESGLAGEPLLDHLAAAFQADRAVMAGEVKALLEGFAARGLVTRGERPDPRR